ncbi:DUF1214 domain-containing protein [Aciditerrimonas ferrireducens]|uniref:DUF1214 domain-containing protein n=1 Tax=Aciditerrimonas ferrireducens TaxID=667306 RepID=A0ABV6BZX7_9ACTN
MNATALPHPPQSHGPAQMAWSDLTNALAEATALVETSTEDALDRAEGHRFLLRLLSAAEELFVERADPLHPSFTRVTSPIRKYFGDNPDTVYDSAPLDPTKTYRITGQRGTCCYLAFCVYGSGGPEGNRIVANLADRDLDLSPEGRFSLVLSPEPHPGPWIRLEPDARSVVARQYRANPATEQPASYQIECLDATEATPPPLDEQRVARGVSHAATFLRTVAQRTAAAAASAARSPNAVSLHSRDGAAAFFGTPDNAYEAGWFSLEPDQALVLTLRPPACRYWSVQLWDRWMESIDARYHQGSRNHTQVKPEPDGTYRLIIAERDPGVGNWLDPAGHRSGWFCVRWLLATETPSPTVEVLPLSSLA